MGEGPKCNKMRLGFAYDGPFCRNPILEKDGKMGPRERLQNAART